MGISARDAVPFTLASAKLSDVTERAEVGAENFVTRKGESYAGQIDADRLDYYHRLERERIHLLLLADAHHGLGDIAVGRTQLPMSPSPVSRSLLLGLVAETVLRV